MSGRSEIAEAFLQLTDQSGRAGLPSQRKAVSSGRPPPPFANCPKATISQLPTRVPEVLRR